MQFACIILISPKNTFAKANTKVDIINANNNSNTDAIRTSNTITTPNNAYLDFNIKNCDQETKKNIQFTFQFVNFLIKYALMDSKFDTLLTDGISKDAIDLFLSLSSKLDISTISKFPQTIVTINGAPGAGKGTNTRTIMRHLDIVDEPIIASDLLKVDPVLLERINQGLLINDNDVVYVTLKKLLECGKNGINSIILDGYPRTKMQAEIISVLKFFSENLLNIPMRVISVVFTVDAKTSIARQLHRGQEALHYNENLAESSHERVEVRPTDLDQNSAFVRYNQFVEKTLPGIRFLKTHSEYYEIDACGSFDEVKQKIEKELIPNN